jgi:Polyketide cyclase / dehydrase and lipid transport
MMRQQKTETDEGGGDVGPSKPLPMAPVVRIATTAAKPSTIWQTCFVPMTWQDWDVDVKTVEDVQGGGCKEGGTFVFVMKDSEIRAKTTLSNVVENQSLTYSGGFYGGLVRFQGDFCLEPDGLQNTKITYTFEMKGILGAMVGTFKSEMIVHGTEKGLENIVRLSEAAKKQ